MMPRSGDHTYEEKSDVNVFSSAVLPLRPQEFPLSLPADVFTLQRLAEQDGTFCLNCKHQTFLKKQHLCPKENITAIQNQRKNSTRNDWVVPWVCRLRLKLDVHIYIPMLVTWFCDKPPFFVCVCFVVVACLFCFQGGVWLVT